MHDFCKGEFQISTKSAILKFSIAPGYCFATPFPQFSNPLGGCYLNTIDLDLGGLGGLKNYVTGIANSLGRWSGLWWKVVGVVVEGGRGCGGRWSRLWWKVVDARVLWDGVQHAFGLDWIVTNYAHAWLPIVLMSSIAHVDGLCTGGGGGGGDCGDGGCVCVC